MRTNSANAAFRTLIVWMGLWANMPFPDAAAHDSWLVAGQSTTDVNVPVRVALVTGEVFPISDHAAKPEHVREWIAIAGTSRRRVEGFAIEGQELAARVALDAPGLHGLGIALQPSFIELAAADFQEYLEDEKATAALELRRTSGTVAEPGRERYTKFAKTFVEAGTADGSASAAAPVGHTLEIVPQSNPCRWVVGKEVSLRVLLEGKPANGLRVAAGHVGLPPHTYVYTAVTDAEGVARFTPTRPGLWFLRTHTIRPLKTPQPPEGPSDAPKADWESFWASLTFRVVGETVP